MVRYSTGVWQSAATCWREILNAFICEISALISNITLFDAVQCGRQDQRPGETGCILLRDRKLNWMLTNFCHNYARPISWFRVLTFEQTDIQTDRQTDITYLVGELLQTFFATNTNKIQASKVWPMIFINTCSWRQLGPSHTQRQGHTHTVVLRKTHL